MMQFINMLAYVKVSVQLLPRVQELGANFSLMSRTAVRMASWKVSVSVKGWLFLL